MAPFTFQELLIAWLAVSFLWAGNLRWRPNIASYWKTHQTFAWNQTLAICIGALRATTVLYWELTIWTFYTGSFWSSFTYEQLIHILLNFPIHFKTIYRWLGIKLINTRHNIPFLLITYTWFNKIYFMTWNYNWMLREIDYRKIFRIGQQF